LAPEVWLLIEQDAGDTPKTSAHHYAVVCDAVNLSLVMLEFETKTSRRNLAVGRHDAHLSAFTQCGNANCHQRTTAERRRLRSSCQSTNL
jgi:hypothetical protein